MALSRSSSRDSSGRGHSTQNAALAGPMVERFVQAQAQQQALEQARQSSEGANNAVVSNASFSSVSTASTGLKMTSSASNSPTLISNVPTPAYGNSMLPSPEPLRGRDLDPIPISSFQLPESMLSHKMSETSLLQNTPPLSMQQGGGSTTSMSQAQEASRQNGSIIRRLSNRASRAITRRRPSSAHPNSRDVSVGPGILRRRSDSNNTTPVSDILDRPTFDTDSEFEVDERDDGDSIAASMFDGIANTDASATIVGTSSVNGSVATAAAPTPAEVGPVIPLALLHGISIRKVSKKHKRVLLTLDAEAGKVSWDRFRPSKSIYIDDIKEIRTAEDIRQYRYDCNVPESDEGRFFSILYQVPGVKEPKVKHFIADSEENFLDWTTTLDAIYKHRQDLIASLMAFNDKAVRGYWNREMAKQSSEKLNTQPSTALAGEIDFAGVERVCRNLHIHVPQERLRTNFASADVHKTGRLNYAGFQEFVRLMKKRGDIHAIYRTLASNASLGITRDEFFDFLRNTQGENVDDELASWETVFSKFARRPKASSSSGKDIAVISDGESAISGSEEVPRMSEAGLASYLTSTYNLSFIKEPKEYTFDRPMNEYYISSSHNTYLVGRQIAGTSSVEGYISALTRGCRCVEIDCWDGADGQPIVNHGKTLSSSMSFREAVNAINRYAFVKSPFPLWISLEVHCNPEQQRIMARIMREVFGSKLVTEPLSAATNRLPSPTELRGRILIKTKKTQQPTTATLPPLPLQTASEVIAANTSEFSGRRRGNSLPTPYYKALTLDGNVPNVVYSPTYSQPSPLSYSAGQSPPVLSPGYSTPTTPRKASTPKARVATVNTITEGQVARETPSSSTSDCDSGSEKAPTKHKQSKIVPELGCLAVYCVGVHKTTPFEDPECKAFNHILSWDETVYDRSTKARDYRQAVYFHNMRYLMRVYPKAYRFGSSNFNPLGHWRRGVQMSALNWQTYDLGMQLNAAMFTGGTDESGYVLKPRECRQFQVLPNLPGESKPRELKRERKNVNFSIGVVSAQQLMRPVNFPDRRTLDPYIEVEVFMADDKRDRDESKQQSDHVPLTPLIYRTKIAPGNGFNPVFDQRFNFRFTTKYPDLVFVRMSVKLADNGKYTSANPTATFTAKLSNLKQGYRTIPLVDVNADRYMFSTLLCEIHKEPITSVFVPCATDAAEGSTSTNKLKSIRTVFNRTTNQSPKSSIDSGPS
ncbi:1-phosphatidylinositol-4,5-bisphosphate phosphodiesterase [Sporothrix brasiliensis 5110]|uniref:Phosphoinositide phospholipase C n=1 Tax=Sporothrix brasiliensis 5110 TaxID=1398154 RepID=A0A0C2J191_9PEZI|nr:1-phosphatidylinositol-4,5-bisphosphate phosphodiesterase [Sporothrix brasiliensis 5110]KIH90887.1 1-phosphatidylinositol-4,5-bisphosphate phosphodiesterase [Sporothrix brasiliensis 5110]